LKFDRESRTAQGIAAVRAAETYRPPEERLFEDPFARGFLSPFYRALVEISRFGPLRNLLVGLYDRRLPGTLANAICRTRLIDDALKTALADGVTQVLILGAGFDSRAYRVPGVERARVFEVDHPATQRSKRERLSRMIGTLPPHVVLVPIDFNEQKLDTALAAAGFRVGAGTFVIWEGVTGYLTPNAVDATLRYVSSATAPGSRIVFTYLHRGVLDGSARFEGAEEVIAYVKKAGEPFTFGLDPADLQKYLAERGFDLIEDVGPEEYQARYMMSGGPTVKVSAFSRAALARVVFPPHGHHPSQLDRSIP
jgi:methyltransferase (TIGR00027 family)